MRVRSRLLLQKARKRLAGLTILELMRCLWIALNAVEHQIFEVLLGEVY